MRRVGKKSARSAVPRWIKDTDERNWQPQTLLQNVPIKQGALPPSSLSPTLLPGVEKPEWQNKAIVKSPVSKHSLLPRMSKESLGSLSSAVSRRSQEERLLMTSQLPLSIEKSYYQKQIVSKLTPISFPQKLNDRLEDIMERNRKTLLPPVSDGQSLVSAESIDKSSMKRLVSLEKISTTKTADPVENNRKVKKEISVAKADPVKQTEPAGMVHPLIKRAVPKISSKNSLQVERKTHISKKQTSSTKMAGAIAKGHTAKKVGPVEKASSVDLVQPFGKNDSKENVCSVKIKDTAVKPKPKSKSSTPSNQAVTTKTGRQFFVTTLQENDEAKQSSSDLGMLYYTKTGRCFYVKLGDNNKPEDIVPADLGKTGRRFVVQKLDDTTKTVKTLDDKTTKTVKTLDDKTTKISKTLDDKTTKTVKELHDKATKTVKKSEDKTTKTQVAREITQTAGTPLTDLKPEHKLHKEDEPVHAAVPNCGVARPAYDLSSSEEDLRDTPLRKLAGRHHKRAEDGIEGDSPVKAYHPPICRPCREKHGRRRSRSRKATYPESPVSTPEEDQEARIHPRLLRRKLKLKQDEEKMPLAARLLKGKKGLKALTPIFLGDQDTPTPLPPGNVFTMPDEDMRPRPRIRLRPKTPEYDDSDMEPYFRPLPMTDIKTEQTTSKEAEPDRSPSSTKTPTVAKPDEEVQTEIYTSPPQVKAFYTKTGRLYFVRQDDGRLSQNKTERQTVGPYYTKTGLPYVRATEGDHTVLPSTRSDKPYYVISQDKSEKKAKPTDAAGEDKKDRNVIKSNYTSKRYYEYQPPVEETKSFSPSTVLRSLIEKFDRREDLVQSVFPVSKTDASHPDSRVSKTDRKESSVTPGAPVDKSSLRGPPVDKSGLPGPPVDKSEKKETQSVPVMSKLLEENKALSSFLGTESPSNTTPPQVPGKERSTDGETTAYLPILHFPRTVHLPENLLMEVLETDKKEFSKTMVIDSEKLTSGSEHDNVKPPLTSIGSRPNTVKRAPTVLSAPDIPVTGWKRKHDNMTAEYLTKLYQKERDKAMKRVLLYYRRGSIDINPQPPSPV